jgi:hypothetical protein
LRTDFLPPAGEQDGVSIEPLRVDALYDPLPRADVGVANLLVHHFDDADVVQLLARLHAACRLGGAVFDLERNAWAFGVVRWLFPLWVRSPVTAADSLISVQQAFRPEELLRLAREAGIGNARVRSCLRIRLLLQWRSEGPSNRES